MSARDETYAAKVPGHRRTSVTQAAGDVAPRPVLSGIDVVAIVIGLVIGAGIFKAPAVVAANTSSEWMFIGAWVLGGFISLSGALCYAELASAYPSAGGEYHFLTRAYGKRVAFLFA